MKLYYLLPGYYFFISRLNSFQSFFGWLIGYFIPIFFFIFSINNFTNYFEIILSFIVIISFYEIGYLKNDLYTTRNEKNPTLRIRDNILYSGYMDHISIFIFIRIIFLLSFFIITKNAQILILILITQIFFYIHNLYRSKINVITFFLVNQSKNISFIFILDEILLFDILFFGLIFFYRSIENLSRPIFYSHNKYFNLIDKNTHIFRVIYFTILLIFLNLFLDLSFTYQFFITYMLFIRIIFLIKIKFLKQ